jgi:hypothetical protein
LGLKLITLQSIIQKVNSKHWFLRNFGLSLLKKKAMNCPVFSVNDFFGDRNLLIAVI